MKKLYFLLLILSLTPCLIFGQNQELEERINKIIEGKNAKVGVGIIYQGKDTVTINNNWKYPTMSVFKFFQALALLDYMDTQNIPLETELFIKKIDLRDDTHSPLRSKQPEGNFNISLGELMQYTVSHSDNNTSNFLFDKMLGVTATHLYLRSLGIEKFEIVATEHEMSESFEAQYLDWITPLEAAQVLEHFHSGTLLSFKHHEFLKKAMIETSSGLNKIVSLLPKDVVVVHKTGMSGRNADGLKAADNDIATVYMPNGKHFSLAIFVTDSMESDDTNAKIIAQIAQIVYDHYSE